MSGPIKYLQFCFDRGYKRWPYQDYVTHNALYKGIMQLG